MITSALISQLRREYGDVPKSVSVAKQGNGEASLFNVGKFPVVEGSYSVFLSGSIKTEFADYYYDLDNGDIEMTSIPPNGAEIRSDHKYAEWRDKNWVEAINQGIEALNSQGFFRQVVRAKNVVGISAGVTESPAPSGAVDVYEVLVSDNYTSGGNFSKPRANWSYQQDANKIVWNDKPSTANKTSVSYLRNLQTYSATSATIDSLDDWLELIKKKAGAIFYRSLAGKIAKQGNSTIDEGHFSFTNLRTMSKDLDDDFKMLAMRKKPTRPAKDFQFNI
jgi:hypothetical protein